MIDLLCDLDESPWGDLRGKPLDSRTLARMLSKYGIKPRPVRVGDSTPRGYVREDLHDAWSRYLPPSPAGSATSATPQQRADARGATGAVCELCGEPMIVVEPGQATHPTCTPRRAA